MTINGYEIKHHMKKYQIDEVRAYLNRIKRDNERPDENPRPTLQTIQHCRLTNKQFMVDGYCGFMWDTYAPELEQFEQTPKEKSIGIHHIIPTNPEYKTTRPDLSMWEHIREFKQFTKQKVGRMDVMQNKYAYIFGRYFDPNFIQWASVLMGNDLHKLKVFADDNKPRTPIVIKNETMTAILLPVRYTDGHGNDITTCNEINIEFNKMLATKLSAKFLGDGA